MVPAKYPPKVKLELFSTLECQRGINYALIYEGIGAFIIVEG